MTTWLVAPLCYLDDDEDNTTRKSSRKIMLATAMQKVHVYDPETRTLETVLSAVAGDFGAVAEIRGIAHSGSAVYGAASMMESVRAAQAENTSILDRAKRICQHQGVSTSTFSLSPCIASARRENTLTS
ncbi:hypothetical protein PR202_gb08115 [Eleusine coracana subsp. coracana]|uniref:Uncharacterized protein n=1 Tax=Eleusine coracana subsp. coracana TaxID=191504 RepID=A0AAV5EDU0_ELECO|nr:hypothetical protein PR202_gb08115 [Eleusine coracana subsp. coracana]